ncbi:AraC family transcriptional regulator [Aliagarivorans marinus]|uniref:AraC family transcriptional regulator n=1 Tax=Aliagarivorans marinus TaxID=561965 RepID=UPI000479F4CE|nr:AraC family transcriptional regulator [Aliagarivorans marinus]
MDELSSLLQRLAIKAGVFHSGPLCGLSQFDKAQGGHLHLLQSGRLELQISGHAVQKIDQPHLLFFPRAKSHRLFSPDESASLVCADLSFGSGSGRLIEQALPEYLLLPLAEFPQLQRCLEMLFAEAFASEPGRQLISDRLSEVLITLLLRELLSRGKFQQGVLAGLCHPKLVKALNAIHEDLSQVHSLQSLSEQAGMSRSSFAQTFSEVMQCSPGDYLSELRLAEAQQLLLAGRPLAIVAEEVGYASLSGLNRAFRGRFACSPKQWLAQQS